MTDSAQQALDALRATHDRLWDDDVSLERLAPGTTPGQDLSELKLHAVRETALSGFLDLGDGNVLRATRAIERVLQSQYRESSVPWAPTRDCHSGRTQRWFDSHVAPGHGAPHRSRKVVSVTGLRTLGPKLPRG
jgi:hypothetical protein